MRRLFLVNKVDNTSKLKKYYQVKCVQYCPSQELLMKISYSLLIVLILIGTSCKGQIERDTTTQNTSAITEQYDFIKSQSMNAGDNVHCAVQDSVGNIWFGTTGDGIFKYDGNVFTHYTVAHGLNSNTIWSILVDAGGKVWIGTDNGICSNDDNQFANIELPLSGLVGSNAYDVWSIMQDSKGKLWFATGVGVFVYDGTSFSSFDTGIVQSKDCVFGVEMILEDSAGNYWFGGRCNPGVYRYDGKSFAHLLPDDDDWAWPVLEDNHGNIWFSSWEGAYKYDGESFMKFTKASGLSGNMIARINEDKNGNLWFGGDGLTRYDGASFTKYTKENGLKNTSIWAILEDNAGNIWVGTRETGLYLFGEKTFSKYSE